MYKFLAIIALCFGLLSLLSVAATVYAYFNNGGMAVLAFQLWTIIAALAALVLGGVSRWLSHKAMIRHALPAKLGILASALALVIYAALLLILR